MKEPEIRIKDFKFFKEYHDEFLKSLTENDKEQFMSCANDEEKFSFIHDRISGTKLDFNLHVESSKNNGIAQSFKDKGNKCFQQEKYEESVKMYNEALIHFEFVEGTSKDISIVFANRSAALYHLEKYEAALEDIRVAQNLGYPKDIVYKVKDRKAKCLLALHQNKSALEALKDALVSVDDSKLPVERKNKMRLDIQIMISMLSKHKKLTNEPLHQSEAPLKQFIRSSKTFPYVSNKIAIENNETEGRFAKATENIKAGDNILAEDPYACMLLEGYAKTHCYNCLKRVSLTPFPCKRCSRVIFCSDTCEHIAQTTHHAVECSIIPFIWKSGLSVICYTSLRIMSQTEESFFERIRTYLGDKNEDKSYQLSCSEEKYLKIHNLVSHSDRRPVDDYLHTAHVADFLFQLLKKVNYFKSGDAKMEKFIGGLLLHHIQCLQFNCHEVADLLTSGKSSKTRFIGAAVYPTLSLFNHSCEPNIVRYFQGGKVYVNLCKNIKRGEQICENYGPLYSVEPRSERQQILKTQYWFDCHCIACENNWPLFAEMEGSQDLRFKCETCKNVVIVSASTMDFMIDCDSCNSSMNVFKGLKKLQDTESLSCLANKYMDSGDFQKALEKFLRLITLLDENLVPPYKDYILCQRSIQTCFLNLSGICF